MVCAGAATRGEEHLSVSVCVRQRAGSLPSFFHPKVLKSREGSHPVPSDWLGPATLGNRLAQTAAPEQPRAGLLSPAQAHTHTHRDLSHESASRGRSF